MPGRVTPRRSSRARAADRRLAARLALAALAALLLAVPFALLLVLVESRWQPLTTLDEDVAGDLHQVALDHGWLVQVLDVGAIAFDPWAFRLVIAGVAVWLWRRGARRLAGWAVATVVLGGVLGVVLKLLVQRARPVFDEPVAHAGGYSFPSGHALNSLLCVGVLVLLFLPALGRRGRALAYAAGLLVVLATGLDRVALGVHYLSDVLAAWLVALACLAATAAGFEVWRRDEGRPPSTPGAGVEPEAAEEMTDAQ